MKRVLSLLLVACMLLAVLPFAAFAEEAPTMVTFDFTGAATSADAPVNVIKNEEIGTNWKYYYAPAKGTLLAYPDYVEYATTIEDWYYQEIIDGNGLNKYWFAFKLSGIESGIYDLSFSMNPLETAASLKANVYIIPATGAPNNNSGLTKAIKDGDILGTLNSSKDSETLKKITITGDENGQYIMMFDCVLNDLGHLKDTKIQLKSVVLTKSAQPAPKPTQPTIPDFNAPTEPADDAGSSFPVVPVVIAAVAVVAVAAVAVVIISKKKKNSAE